MTRVESSSFAESVLSSQLSSLEVTNFVLTQSASNSAENWNAFMLHSSNQFFVKVPDVKQLSKSSLLTLLGLVEELGVHEVFVCVPATSVNCDYLVSEFVSLDFELVSPRSQPIPGFVVLRFDF